MTPRTTDEAIKLYWNERLQKRSIYAFPMVHDRGTDFEGDLPWPQWVSLNSIHEDFIFWSPRPVGLKRAAFSAKFRRIAGITNSRVVTRTVYAEDGTPLFSRSQTLYDVAHLCPRPHGEPRGAYLRVVGP